MRPGRAPFARRCVACRATRDRRALLRLVHSGDSLSWDRDQRMPGRGWYLCRAAACVQRGLAARSRWAKVGAAIEDEQAQDLRRRLLEAIAEAERAEARD